MFLRSSHDAIYSNRSNQDLFSEMTFDQHRRRVSISSTVILLVMATSYWPGLTHGHRTGSPSYVCRSMMPGHGHAAQNSSAPYRLVANDVGSSRFRVELTASEPDDYFIGFLIEARGLGNNLTAIGSFQEWTPDNKSAETANFKTLDCNEAPVSIPGYRVSRDLHRF